MNTLKTTFFLTLLTLLFVGFGSILGGQSGALMALIMAGVMNVVAYWFSDKMVLAMYRAKQVTEAEAPELHSIVRELAMRAEIPMPKVYIMENPAPNAFATGRNPNHAAVAATTGIISLLSRDELRGVMAHELAHVKHRDILLSTIAATVAGAISYLAYMAQWGMMFGGGDRRENNNPLGMVLTVLMMILAPMAAMMIQMAISRSREFKADEGGAKISGTPQALASALKKLHTGVQRVPMVNANPATAHMFIINPLTGGGLMKLFSTHPPMEERIARLEAMRRV